MNVQFLGQTSTRLLQNLFENFIATNTRSFDVRPISSHRPRLLIRPSMGSCVHGLLFTSATTTRSAVGRPTSKSTRITREEACWLARPPVSPQHRVIQKFSSSPMQTIPSRNTAHFTSWRLWRRTLSDRSTSRDRPTYRGVSTSSFPTPINTS